MAKIRFFLAITVFIVIAVLHAIPGQDLSDLYFTDIFQIDKFFHAFLFAIGFFTSALAVSSQYNSYLLRYVTILYVLYGAFLEIAQQFFLKNRYADIFDWIADLVGILIGFLLFRKLKYLFK